MIEQAGCILNLRSVKHFFRRMTDPSSLTAAEESAPEAPQANAEHETMHLGSSGFSNELSNDG